MMMAEKLAEKRHAKANSSAAMQHMGLGVVIMAVSVIWLVGGLMAGWLYYYPAILFIVGIITVINVAFDPTTDPPQFDIEFLASRLLNPSGGPTEPLLGICQIIGHKEIRRTEKQADDSATSTIFAFPYEHVELKIWFAPPGKPRPTSKTTGNGVDELQLVRIDMSETINEQEPTNEIPA
ncbi:MAG: hypothetical protein Q8M16_13050, partial [Pirellulaceae bacterium]|nr:hypothetical protein [Pirellulaceae bacterium]